MFWMWGRVLGLLGSACWLGVTWADPWTGPGSFYTFNEKNQSSEGLISERAYVDFKSNITIPWKNFYNILTLNSPHENYPAAFVGNKSIVLIGDATDQHIVRDVCHYLSSKSNASKKVTVKSSNDTTHVQCQLRNGISSLTISHIRTFGFQDDPDPSLQRRFHVNDTSVESILRKNLRPFGLGLAGVPDYVALQSCLWDMHKKKSSNSKGKQYDSLLVEYYNNADHATQLLRQLLPESILIFNSCKPLNHKSKSYMPKLEDHVTTVALDNMIRLLASQGWAMDDLVDNSALLRGYEGYAPDGKHYHGEASHTVFNAFLNAFEEVSNRRSMSRRS